MADIGGLPLASSPEALGFDSGRLARLDAWMSGMVDMGQVAGTSTLLMRHGQVAAFQTFGQARLDSGAPLRRDALFRIYSMTKPVTSTAMMILFEEGRWRLEDPITSVLPELADLQVCSSIDGDGAMTAEPQRRPATMRELMSHTAGFGYGLFDIHPVEQAYRQAGVLEASSLEDLAARAAGIPLISQPGTQWFYSIANDLQALVVQRLSGQSFGEFLSQRIFEPLGMVDTGHQTRADNCHRLCTMYADDRRGRLKEADTAFGLPIGDATRPPPFEGGGGGLVSTASDYARFCQMILNGGELDGERILSPITVELMATDALSGLAPPRLNPLRLPFGPSFGFGLGFSVALDPRRLGLMEGRGTLSWGGGGGTWFWIDPQYDIVFVGLIQRLQDPVSSEFRARARTFTYQALTRPEL